MSQKCYLSILDFCQKLEILIIATTERVISSNIFASLVEGKVHNKQTTTTTKNQY